MKRMNPMVQEILLKIETQRCAFAQDSQVYYFVFNMNTPFHSSGGGLVR